MGLTHFEQYGRYACVARLEPCMVNVSEEINCDTWNQHFNSVLNLLKDGIETSLIQSTFINIQFGDGTAVKLSLIDYYFNIMMWYLIVFTNQVIQPYHIFFENAITKSAIKNYIDKFCIIPNRKTLSNRTLNNVIDDCLHNFCTLENFSFYLANTINIEDDIALMRSDKEYYDLLHADLSGIPVEEVKNKGLELTYKAIDKMKHAKDVIGYDHCLADSWRAGEGINPKQYKEFAINIGTKPNGRGGIYPGIINSSFINGGLKDLMSMFIESGTGRTAQIMAKRNVGDSGAFARLMGLNNMDTFLNPDRNYVCNSVNFVDIVVSEPMLKLLDGRYYRLYPNGLEFNLNRNDVHLIGQRIYLRSPMTCNSHALGQGICYRCYGDLAYTNYNICIGKIAAEEISSRLTQRLLSAKHLIDTRIDKPKWNDEFGKWFEMDDNIVKIGADIQYLKGYNLVIDLEEIEVDNEDDITYDSDGDIESGASFLNEYNEHIAQFYVQTPDGVLHPIFAEDYKLYISKELNGILRRRRNNVSDSKVHIHMNTLEDTSLFLLNIRNNDLSKTMNQIMNIIDKVSVTTTKPKNQLLQEFLETIIEGDLNVSAVHCETILSNQIRSKEDILLRPQWEFPDEECSIYTLTQSLKHNPSPVISLMFGWLSRELIDPLTFRKHKASAMDLFFMERPQEFLGCKDEIIVERPEKRSDDTTLITPVVKYDNTTIIDMEDTND